MSGARPQVAVMGLSPTGLHVVRSLARQGARVTGVAQGFQPGRWSRHLSACIVAPDPEARIAALCARFAEAADPAQRPVLIPTSDQDVELVIAHAEALARRFAFQASYSDGLAARIMAKDSFYTLCNQHGLKVPAMHAVRVDGLEALAETLAWPCLVKPALIHEVKHLMRGRKAWIARNLSEFRALARELPAGIGTLIVQEVVPGPESAITLYCAHVDAEGRARQAFTARKLRQYPPGFGSASLAQSCPEPETAALSEALLGAIGYRGIAALEFKRHPGNGALYVIEMNVRPSLWFALGAAAGRDVVASAWRELAGLAPLAEDRPQADGLRWRYALKDMASAAFYRGARDFVLPSPDIEAVGPATAHCGPVFAAGDPAPALAELAGYAAKGMARLWPGRAE